MYEHDNAGDAENIGKALTISQAVLLSGRSRRSIYRDMDRGVLPYFVASNGRRTVYEHDIKKTYEGMPMAESQPVTPKRKTGADDGLLLSESEILGSSVALPPTTGVYFLIQGERVVYVGQSTNLYARLAAHKKTKRFERVSYIPCKESELDALETLYIHFLKPKLNGMRSNGSPVAPMASKALVSRFARPDATPHVTPHATGCDTPCD